MTPHALRGPEWLNDFSRGAGCEGVEYMPMLDLVPGHTARAIGRAVAKGDLDLNSLHATFREGRASAETNKLPGDPENPKGLVSKVLGSPLGRLVLPEVISSAAVMGKIQEAAGKEVPTVLYPQADRQADFAQIRAAHGSEYLFQPTDHVARLVRADSLEAFEREMGDDETISDPNPDLHGRGYGYVWDTFHGRRRYGRDTNGLISDTRHSVSYLADNIRALHLSLDRSDIPGEPHIPTKDEGRKALRGLYDGELRDNLDAIKEAGYAEYMVIEATAPSIGSLIGSTDIVAIQDAYADIANGFRAYWDAA
jgi:hypothetical protein